MKTRTLQIIQILLFIAVFHPFAAFAQSNTDKVRQFERLIGEWKSDGYSTGSEKYTQLKYMVSEGCKMNERVAKAYIDEQNATTIDIRVNSWLQYIKEKRISITLRDLREKTGYDGKRIVYCYIKYTQPGKQDREDFVGFKIDGGKIFYICNDDMELANRLKEDSERQVVDNKPVQQQQLPATTGNDLTFTVSGVTFKMKYVQGGTFSMGSDDSDAYADSDEEPVHTVTLSDYYIGETEVTCGLWKTVMGSNPSYFKKGDNYPMENVSWDSCQVFIQKLNQKTGRTFRLPTEAEWEYAARGGSKSRGYKYSGSNNLSEVAWYGCNDNNDKNRTITTYTTMPVKTKKPNELGLYDMSGTVCEWCNDWYKSDYYANSPSTNPQGPSSGSSRVLRGGSWINYDRYCRSSNRNYLSPDYRYDVNGLRLALVP